MSSRTYNFINTLTIMFVVGAKNAHCLKNINMLLDCLLKKLKNNTNFCCGWKWSPVQVFQKLVNEHNSFLISSCVNLAHVIKMLKSNMERNIWSLTLEEDYHPKIYIVGLWKHSLLSCNGKFALLQLHLFIYSLHCTILPYLKRKYISFQV